jgi:hypothetical protein
LIAHSVNLIASCHLQSIEFDYNNTTEKLFPSFSYVAAKQGPAASVIPVFAPLKPLTSKSLFEFTQRKQLWSGWLLFGFLTLPATFPSAPVASACYLSNCS